VKRRLVAFLLALVAVVGVVSAQDAVAAPRAAAVAPADGGIISGGVQAICAPTVVGLVGAITGTNYCKEGGDAAEKEVKKEWNDVWNSLLGDLLKSAEDVVKWLMKKVLTLALLGPSLKLQDTGLFGRNATLAGMLVWLGWIIAAFGLMWQIGKMAVTGQTRHLGQAMVGWVQNALLSGIGLTIVASLLSLGDAMTSGLVDKSFGNAGAAYRRIVVVMMPALDNPVLAAVVVGVLILVGGLQLVMIFLRQSAIPIQCLVLPIAGAGRVGGDATRQWAPRLITSMLAAITYKPLLAIIICAGFTEFGHSATLTEWLRGLATLVLGVLAPVALMKVFAPIGAEVGGGLASAGAMGAAANVGRFVGGRGGGRGGRESGGNDSGEPTNAVDHAKHLAQTMPKSYRDGGAGKDGAGQDALAQAARNQATAKVPNPAGSQDGTGLIGGDKATGAGTGVAAGTGSLAKAAGPVGLSLTVLDGVNDAVQKGANQIGEGGKSS
jgi:type IV secretion system protein TrbL